MTLLTTNRLAYAIASLLKPKLPTNTNTHPNKRKNVYIYIPSCSLYNVHFTDIDYADDIAVITDSLIDENTLLHTIEDTAKYTGLHINSSKTKYTCLNHENQIGT